MNDCPLSRCFEYALTPDASTFADRVEAACKIIEREIPSATICFGIPYNPSDRENIPKVEDRLKYLHQRTKTKLWRFCLDNGKGWPDQILVKGSVFGGDRGVLGVAVDFPAAPWEFCEKLFVELGDVLGANFSTMLPLESLTLWATQFNASVAEHDPTLIERGIPQLQLVSSCGVADRIQPMYLGWLNYWSEATCAFLGFSGNKKDLTIAPHSYKTPGNAWLVKLTSSPLDVCCPDHVDTLVAAYRKWPRVGDRRLL